MLHVEAARSNSTIRSQDTVRGRPTLRDDRWSGASLRASLSDVEVDSKMKTHDKQLPRRSQSVDVVNDLTPASETHYHQDVMIHRHRDVSNSVLSESAKSATGSGGRRRTWVSPRKLLERVKTRKSRGSPARSPGIPRGKRLEISKE